jgi:citrate lyase subunit beta/citryl-CoA lyase
MKPRRSYLAVPASQPRFIAKADQSEADEVFLDLEDSVAPSAKTQVRLQVVEALHSFQFAGKIRAVRVNPCDSKWCYEDIIMVIEEAGASIDSLIIPKVEDADHVHYVDHLLNQVEWKVGLDKHIGLELQIETARGLENVGAIAQASRRTETLIFGPADFCASLGIPELTGGGLKPEYPGDFWHYFLCRLVVAARAHELQPIAGPYAQIRDPVGLRISAEHAAMLGFDGKWALNPGQIAVLNEVFTPRQHDFDKASAIIEAYGRATQIEGTGAVMLGDEMIDEASRKVATAMVERGQAFGMTARPWQPLSSKA